MNLRKYTYLWALLTLVITYEFLMLSRQPELSILHGYQGIDPAFKGVNLNLEAGKPISLVLGWAGIGLMVLTNLYILRKRMGILKNLGKLSGWMDFHIFCGLLGPTLVVFHSNFKVRGLVSLSFWSMMIVAVSGVVGRYFYVQVLQRKADFEQAAERYEKSLEQLQKNTPSVPIEKWGLAKQSELIKAGGRLLLDATTTQSPGFIRLMWASLIGDMRLALTRPALAQGMPVVSGEILRHYAVSRRRVLFFDSFKQYLGYWHSFHLPFAFLMYIFAAVHIATALLFSVSH